MISRTEDDAAYSATKCADGHSDGSHCLPSWDGFVYICTYRILNDSTREYTLMEANGPISDRLRKQFDKDDPAWNPPRDETEPEAKPLPKGRDGWSVTGRGKK